MRPDPIPTKSKGTISSYVLLLIVVFVFASLLTTFLQGELAEVLAEIGRVMLGMPKR